MARNSTLYWAVVFQCSLDHSSLLVVQAVVGFMLDSHGFLSEIWRFKVGGFIDWGKWLCFVHLLALEVWVQCYAFRASLLDLQIFPVNLGLNTFDRNHCCLFLLLLTLGRWQFLLLGIAVDAFFRNHSYFLQLLLGDLWQILLQDLGANAFGCNHFCLF